MASPNKLTMYYADESTRLFLEEQISLYGGKNSGSKYLYALVSRERQRINNDAEDKYASEYPSPSAMFYPKFLGGTDYISKGDISFSSLDLVKEYMREASGEEKIISEKRKRLKIIREGILDKIILDYLNLPDASAIRSNVDSFSIIIIKYIKCNYHDFSGDNATLEGEFIAEWKFIRVDSKLWGRYDGKYDFRKIKYMKYADVTEFYGGQGLCKVNEVTTRDNAGAYFIPVSSNTLKFPSGFISRKEPLIVGGFIDQIKTRIDIRPMNETRIKKINNLRQKKTQ